MAKLINTKSFKEFTKSSSAGGIILIFCVVLSLILANTKLSQVLENLLAYEIGGDFSGVLLRYPVSIWINDGLMAIFFLLVGLEIKREMIEGELSSFSTASLPILAAIGGVLAPASIYLLFNSGTNTASGWGIPMATDIAFAITIVSMLGKKVPASLKIFLSALAIVDDLMAIVVIAVFYSSEIHYSYLLFAFGIFGILLLFNRLKVTNLMMYLIPGLIMWYLIHHSGIHATIAGVLTAFALPTTPNAVESPLEKLEHLLVRPVNFLIMPVFAIANTNISIETGMLSGLTSPLGIGIIAGLVLGKPLGITLFSWVAVKLGVSKLPNGASWRNIAGAGMLGGIGFTMSIFIALLSFSKDVHLLSEAKFSVLVASVFSGLFGYYWLSRNSLKPTKK